MQSRATAREHMRGRVAPRLQWRTHAQPNTSRTEIPMNKPTNDTITIEALAHVCGGRGQNTEATVKPRPTKDQADPWYRPASADAPGLHADIQ
jgi:hypothetical protein